MEKTYEIKQKDLKELVDMNTAKKVFYFYIKKQIFDLKLNLGPYHTAYTRNGQYFAIGGKKGHVAIIDSHHNKLITEFQTRELIRDIVFLQDFSLLAVAQKKKIYVYDNQGLEIHCLKYQNLHKYLEYLPYHFLLVSCSDYNITYQDISTGIYICIFLLFPFKP